jgi:hypothetical protein
MRSGWQLWRILIAALLLASVSARAAEQWKGGTLKTVYPLASGDFVLIFDADAPECPAPGPGKYMYVIFGSNGLTAEGAKKIYSAALTALVARTIFYVAFDDATVYCYVNRASVNGS